MRDWLRAQDAKEFEERALYLVNEYSGFTAVDNVKENGKLTLGENTADSSGLRLAYIALLDDIAGKTIPKIDDFTPEQRLFLGFGQVWRENVTNEATRLSTLCAGRPAAYGDRSLVDIEPAQSKVAHGTIWSQVRRIPLETRELSHRASWCNPPYRGESVMLAILSNVVLDAQGDRNNFTVTDLERGIHCSPSSFLMLLLMLWSIPVLIYAILFFPELKQRLRRGGNVHPSGKDESHNTANELLFEYLLPTVAAAAIALMFGLLVGVSWPLCLMLMGAMAVLIGGVAFTLLKMHSLAFPKDRAGRYEFLDPNRSAELRLRAQPQILVKRPADEEPYPHHEDYPESAGEDQGQLTSHLPGSTPFLEDLAVRKIWRFTRLMLVRNRSPENERLSGEG